MNQLDSLGAEWQTLQKSYDLYEVFSLVIKMIAIILASFVLIVYPNEYKIVIGLTLTFWLLDGIWKTFQSRFELRLVQIEVLIQQGSSNSGMQFNQNWQQNRPSTVKLITSYMINSVKPTVAFCYLAIMVLTGLKACGII